MKHIKYLPIIESFSFQGVALGVANTPIKGHLFFSYFCCYYLLLLPPLVLPCQFLQSLSPVPGYAWRLRHPEAAIIHQCWCIKQQKYNIIWEELVMKTPISCRVKKILPKLTPKFLKLAVTSSCCCWRVALKSWNS